MKTWSASTQTGEYPRILGKYPTVLRVGVLPDGFFGGLIFLVPCRTSLVALGTSEQQNTPVVPDFRHPLGLHFAAPFPQQIPLICILKTPFPGQLCFFFPLVTGNQDPGVPRDTPPLRQVRGFDSGTVGSPQAPPFP